MTRNTDAAGPPDPRIERTITLHMQGDWGAMNLHRVCGWLSMELADRCGPGTRMAIWNGRGFVDNVHAVGQREVDVALVTPAAFARAALRGAGVYAGGGHPDLRALGVVPQRDRLVVGISRRWGISSFAQLRSKRPALRLATSFDDGINHVGLAAREVLGRSGVDIERWGGSYLRDERPFETLAHLAEGRADAVVHEAVMLPAWQEIGADLHFLPVEEPVLAELADELGWPDAHLPAGYFPGAPELHTLDFSDFLLVCRADLPDDVAYAIAWVLGETRGVLERQYAHIPPERSPVTYPLDPIAIGTTPIPLHPGAARYYDALTRL